MYTRASLVAQLIICLQCRRSQFNSWVGKIHWRKNRLTTPVFLGFPTGWAGKESACNGIDLHLIHGLERSSGDGNGYPLQYSGLENFMDCIVHGIIKGQIGLNDFLFFFFFFCCVGRRSLSHLFYFLFFILFFFILLLLYFNIFTFSKAASQSTH